MDVGWKINWGIMGNVFDSNSLEKDTKAVSDPENMADFLFQSVQTYDVSKA